MKLVVVDMCPPFTLPLCQRLSSVLLKESSLCVFSSRAPQAMLLACLGVHYEVLYPLQPISHPALKNSFNALVRYYQDTPIPSELKDETLRQCLEGIEQSLTALRATQQFSSVDLLFITCNDSLKHTLDTALNTCLNNWNKKVTVVTITSTLSTMPVCLTEVEDVSISNNSTEIQKCLRRWYCSTEDRQPVTLTLPGDLSLLCDVEQCLLCVETLPGPVQCNMSLTQPVQYKYKADTSERQGVMLKAIKLLKTDAVCESVLFGYPMLLTATTHWQLDWEVLEQNQTKFAAFCASLASRGYFMLCESSGAVHGKFLILPSSNGTALIKSLACSELVIPNTHSPGAPVLPEIQTQIDDALLSLPVQDDHYSALQHSSNLQEHLVRDMEGNKRRLFNEN